VTPGLSHNSLKILSGTTDTPRCPAQVLTPVQIALYSAAAFPLIPDATAIANVLLEQAEERAASR
jgi:hypothetical protein